MSETKAFELKVGVFMLIGIGILFFIVFSMGDIHLAKAGYEIKTLFNFASGIGPGAPVRLAGVGTGEVRSIRLVYDDKAQKTRAEVTVWLENGTKVEEDAVVTINTLGLLGEKYLEILPGTSGKPVLKPGQTITGKDPVPMEKVTENLANLSDSVSSIVNKLEKGEGTIGKLLTKDEIYNDLASTAGNFKEFSEDIRKHPWKLLTKN